MQFPNPLFCSFFSALLQVWGGAKNLQSPKKTVKEEVGTPKKLSLPDHIQKGTPQIPQTQNSNKNWQVPTQFPGVSKMSRALEQPQGCAWQPRTCTGATWGCPRARERETFARLQGHHHKRPLAPAPIDLGKFRSFGVVQGSQGLKSCSSWEDQ